MTIKPKRRATYRYICKVCKIGRSSLIYRRAVNEVCTNHRRQQPSPNQLALSFATNHETNPGITT